MLLAAQGAKERKLHQQRDRRMPVSRNRLDFIR
jgi:hypothetical protein